MGSRKYFRCPVCGIRFRRKPLLERHLIQHTGTSKFRCKECGLTFAKKPSFTNHLIGHGKSTFRCKECGKCFAKKSSLTNHSFVHTGISKFRCKECGKCFARKTCLTNHLIVHNTELSQFSCYECHKVFVSVHGLERHLLVHNAKFFTCRMCGEAFGSNYDLKRHRLKHRKSGELDSDRIKQSSNDTQFLESGVSKSEDGDYLSVIEEESSEATPDVIEIDEDDLDNLLKIKEERSEVIPDVIEVDTDVSNNSLEIKTEPVIDVCLPKTRQRREMSKVDCGDNSNHLSVCSGKEENFVAPDVIEIKTEVLDDTFETGTEAVTDNHLQYFPKQTETMKLICVVCGKVLKTKTGFKKHLIRHRKSRKRNSDSSKQSESGILTEGAEIDKQLQIISSTPNLQCGQCLKIFDANAKSDFDRHLAIHDKKSGFTCIECSQIFDSKLAFIEHLITHTRETGPAIGEPTILPPTEISEVDCGDNTSDLSVYSGKDEKILGSPDVIEIEKEVLDDPIEIVTIDDDLPMILKPTEISEFDCDDFSVRPAKVEQIFVTPYAIETKTEVLDDTFKIAEKPVSGNQSQITPKQGEIMELVCVVCGKELKTKSGLRRHLVRHRKLGELYSDINEQSESEILETEDAVTDDYSEIISQHTEIPEFRCVVCGRKLKTEAGFEQHVLRHRKSGELSSDSIKPSESGILGTEEAEIDKINSQQTSTLNLQCGQCQQVFTRFQRVEFARHLAIHDRKAGFTCTECGRAFDSKHSFIQHLITHTRE